MNKRFILVAAFCAAMNLASFAQTNLAKGKTPEKIGTVVTGENIPETLDGLTDGNTAGDVYLLPAGSADGDAIQAFEIDLGESYDLAQIKIIWEGAATKDVNIYVSDDNEIWTNVVNESGKGQRTEDIFNLPNGTKGRYVKFEATEAVNSGWGVKMREFEVYKKEASKLATVKTSKNLIKVGDTFTITSYDQYSSEIEATYDVSNATKQDDGSYKVDAEGDVTIKATDANNNSVEKKVYGVENAPVTHTLASNEEAIFIDNTDGLTSYNKGWDGGYATDELMELNGGKAYYVTNVATFGWLKESIADTDYATLNFDIFSNKDLDNVYVRYEGTNLADMHFNVKAGEWNHISLDVKGGAVYNKYITFRLGADKADNNPDILLSNVYLAKAVAEESVLTSITASNNYVTPGQTFTVSALDQNGNAMTEEITYEATNATKQENGSFKADAEGTITIKATDAKDNSAIVTLTAIAAAPTAPTLTDTDMPLFLNGDEDTKVADAAWNEKYGTSEIIDLNENKVWHVTNVGTFGFIKESITDTDYKTLYFDIYSTKDVNDAYVSYEQTGFEKLQFSLKANQWNHIQIDVDGVPNFAKYIQLYLGKKDVDTNPDIFIDNVYLSKSAIQGVVIGTADDKGFVSVKGTISASDLSTLAEQDGTAFDLTKLNIADDVNLSDIHFKNPNAILVVPGSVDQANNNALDYDAKWNDVKNVVLKRADGYYFPISQLQITDKYAVYRTFYISTGTTGFKYTRSLSSKKYSTVFMPRAITTLPEGVKAYEFTTDVENANNVVLKEVTTLDATTPYIVYNDNDVATDLVCDGTDDMDFSADDKNTPVGNLNVIGTYNYFNGDDATQYGIQSEEGAENQLTLKKIGTGAIVCPFRVYFTLNDGNDAKSIKFSFDSETTGINEVNKANSAKQNNIYSIDGKLVKRNATSTQGLAKGVYIINGKKQIVK